MHTISSLALLVALVPGLAALEFTKPDMGKKLNLSSPEIIIAWKVDPHDGVGTEDHNLVDIWWQSPGFGYQLTKNYPLSAGESEFKWNPQEQKDALASTKIILSPEKIFVFEARVHAGVNSTRGAGVESGKYAVEGYPRISAGNQFRVGWGAAVVAGFATTGLFLV
ncbi:hypothetical protein B0T25DRAFT_540696 [Lasiosphaeria hispida]|uniref:Uncharacterized protein n=1 Tax=Lasiosphaeria hispida TaxID=260671 RepID=A0AAJ0HNQ7_9PEZI|nr:hypothetical protein B0T25DRAFT_540696 [Lasiosphaeria hispida]